MLTDRQLLILRAIVDDYIKTAQPVGSRTLSKRDDVTFSSATIRNEMADLEEMGLIENRILLRDEFHLSLDIDFMSII